MVGDEVNVSRVGSFASDKDPHGEKRKMQKNRFRAALAVAAAAIIPLTLTACTGGIPSNYSGTVTVNQVIQTKTNCTVKVTTSNGKQYTANIGPALKCIGVKKGNRYQVVKGQVRR